MKNKIALVTGSSRGIGRSISINLAREGFDVIIHYNKEKQKALDVCTEISSFGKKSWAVQADLASRDGQIKLVSYVKKVTNKLDLLVNNAGFDFDKKIVDYPDEEIQYVIDLVLTSKIILTKYFKPLLANSEHHPQIINIASKMAYAKLIDTIAPYAAAEAGVIRLTHATAREYRDGKIRCNCIAPSVVRTDYSELYTTENDFARMAENNPIGRIATPQDISNLVIFLSTENSEFINGECIGVHGGGNFM